jgi:hypothetical protein
VIIEDEQLDRAAAVAGVPADLLYLLLALESEVPDLPSAQARNRLSQRVEEILDAAAQR